MKAEFPELVTACTSLPELNQEAGTVWLAFSGGCDSHVLLHLLSELWRSSDKAFTLRAVHINHNIHPDSAMWAEHCVRVCTYLQVPVEVIELEAGKVGERRARSGSEENAARELRYRAFENLLGSSDSLLMAHHADDQVETFFYRLIRGSGLTGLAAIPDRRSLGRGTLVRPLLDASRSQLEAYARHFDLDYLNDPSNESLVHDRNFIRHQVFPILEKRWPGFAKSWLRSSRLLRESDELLEQLAGIDLKDRLPADKKVLSLTGTDTLDNARLRNMIRCWLRQVCREHKWPEPDHVSLGRIVSEVIGASSSAMPEVRWPKGQPVCEIRRYDSCLYLLPVLPPIPENITWPDPAQPILLEGGLGQLTLKQVKTQGFRFEPGQSLSVVFNAEGLQVKPPGEVTRNYRKYCQQKRIPPWKRDRMPMIFRDGDLVAVGNLFIPADQIMEEADNLYQIVWHQADSD